MKTDRPVKTITESLCRLMLFLRQGHLHAAPCPRGRSQERLAPPERVFVLGNGQMLLPGLARPCREPSRHTP